MSDFVVNNTAPIQMTVDQTTRIIEAISPTLTLTRVAGGLKITVRDKSGTSESMVYDGTNGQDGQTGPQGEPGPMPVLSVGNIITGDPGTSVTVTLTGTAANPVLNMSIPRGDKGNTGDTGATGNGIATVVVNQDYTLTVTMTDGTTYTSGSIRGEKGETGDTGATGATPQISVGTVETLDPSEDAYVELDSSSTAEHPKLNFGIPQGVDGDATVDDTAGSGDTAHVWSANKLAGEFASVNSDIADLDEAKYEKPSTGIPASDLADGVIPDVPVQDVQVDGLSIVDEQGVANVLLKPTANSKAPAIVVSDTTAEAVKTFPDGADGMPMGLTVGIEPVQDLHGQENPWPAGGGKNIGHLSATNIYSEQQNTNTYVNNGVVVTGVGAYARCGFSIPVVTGETYTVSAKCKRGSVSVQRIGLSNETGWHYTYGILGTISETLSALSKTITATSDTLCVEVYPGSDSAVITIEDFQVEKNSSATSFAPYSNICPISGWTGAEVTRTGKNLFDKEKYKGIFTDYDFKENGYFHKIIQLEPNTTYTITQNAGTTVTNTIPLISNIHPVNGVSYLDLRKANDEKTFTTDETGRLYIACYDMGAGSTYNSRLDACNVQIEYGNTGSAYEPFGNTYQITFPSSAGTIYGGTLTVNADGTGTLVVDRSSIDLGTRTWTYIQPSTSIPFGTFYNTILNKKYGQLNMICSAYPVKAGFGNDKAIQGNAGASTIYLQDSSFDGDAVALKTSLSGVQLVYELETPQTYTLSALEVIETLKGMNNLWADTGDIKTVNYPADTKLYIDGKIAELQAMILENISNS